VYVAVLGQAAHFVQMAVLVLLAVVTADAWP
jgi:hypothetical protein